MTKKCQKCNTLNDNSNRFCINCGEKLIYNNIPQNQQNQYQQDFNQYQNISETNTKNSPVKITLVIIIVLIIIIVFIISLSTFVLYLV